MQDNQIKVSVIIPVYNAEKYLRKCVDSVLAQTLKEIEIILVDDGSTDSSPKICDEYGKYSNVQVIHQKNAGASAARNAGMTVAAGDYIGFVDSDDYIAEDMYEKLYEKACKYSLDVVVGNFQTVKDGVKLSDGVIKMPADRVVERTEIREILVSPVAKSVTWFAVKSIFRREMLQENGIIFHSGMLGEDALFNLEAMLCADTMYFVDVPFYFYEQTPNSQIRTPYKKNLLEKLSRLYVAKLDVYERHGIHNAKQFLAEYTMSHTLVMLLSNELHRKTSLKEKRDILIRIRTCQMIVESLALGNIMSIRSYRFRLYAFLLKYRGYGLLTVLMN